MNRLNFYCGITTLCAGIIALNGCTNLEVNKFEGSTTDSSRTGYAYMLDFTQYEITVTRTLIGCPAGELPKVKVEAQANATLVPDGDQVYVIDPQSLIGAFKISDTTIDFKDGRLIGFNSNIEDKTADVISSVAVTAGKIALLSSGIPTPIDGGGPPPITCSSEAIQKLANRETNKNLLVAATKSLDDAKVVLTDLTTRYTIKPTQTLANKLKAQKELVDAAQQNVDGIEKKISAANTALTSKSVVTWPETGTTFDSEPMLPLSALSVSEWFDEIALRKLLQEKSSSLKIINNDDDTVTLDNEGETGNAARLKITGEEFAARFPLLDSKFDTNLCLTTPKTDACLQLQSLRSALAPKTSQLHMISFHLVVRGSYGAKGNAATTKDPKAGLRYRVPASGWLYVCEGEGGCDKPEQKDRVILRQAGTIPQLGSVFNLPFSSPIFASGSMSVSFDDQGRLLKGQTKRTNSTALSVAAAADSITNQLQAYEKAKNSAPLTELDNQLAVAKAKKALSDANSALVKSPKESLDEELALLEAQKKVNEARTALGGGRVADLQSQLEITKIEVELAEQREKLAQDPNASDAAVTAQYTAQTAVLNAQKAKLEAEAALIAAEQALLEAKR